VAVQELYQQPAAAAAADLVLLQAYLLHLLGLLQPHPDCCRLELQQQRRRHLESRHRQQAVQCHPASQ
jgi:hypothetical protein